jgi:transposase
MWTLQRLADYLAERTGIAVSSETVRRLLAKHEIVFSQPQMPLVGQSAINLRKILISYGLISPLTS